MNNNIKALAMYGGGVRGLYTYYGFWKALTEQYPHHIKQLQVFMGSSVGAIMALILSLLASHPDMAHQDYIEGVLSEFDFDCLCQLNLETLLEYYGLETGLGLVSQLQTILAHFGYRPDINFQQLYQQTGLVLSVVSANLSTQQAVYFNHINTPDLPVIVAIRASFSIPFLFTPIKIKEQVLVDLDEDPVDRQLLDKLQMDTSEVLCLYMKASHSHVPQTLHYPCQQLEDFRTYGYLIFNYLTKYRKPSLDQRLCLSTGQYNLLNSFALSASQKKYLIHLGYTSTMAWEGWTKVNKTDT